MEVSECLSDMHSSLCINACIDILLMIRVRDVQGSIFKIFV